MGRTIRALTWACLIALAVTATASAAQRRVAVGDAALIPRGAALANAVSPHTQLRVTLSLASRNPIAMHTLALAVATPGDRQYGQTLTVARFAQRFGAPSSALAGVRRALDRDGLQIVRIYSNHLAITASGSAATVERTFDTRLTHVRLADGRRTIVNTTAPTLPAAIAPEVEAVFGLDGVADPEPSGLSRTGAGSQAGAARLARRARRRGARPDIVTGGPQPCAAATATAAPLPPSESSEPSFGYTADGLASAYGLPSLYAQGDAGQGQTILLYEVQSLDVNDVATFQACYGTSTPVSIVPVDTPDPVDAGLDGDGEAALDVDQIIGMAPQASIVVYEASQNDADNNGELLSAIASNHTGKIVSISYGSCEALQGKSIAQAEAKLFDEMAIQGQTVFASSGDTGAQGCERNDGDETPGVSDPASQPTVVGVGGTSLYSGTSASPVPYNGSNALTEGVWNSSFLESPTDAHQAASGGGDSSLWKMPSFQSSAAPGLGVVNGYSGTGGCGASLCREVPDVSAESDPSTGTVIYANTNANGTASGPSQWQTYGGTSAAAPLWAAFTALTNVLPTCRGLSVGDIDPSLYALAGANYAGYFRDVSAPSAFTSLTTNWTDLTTAPSGVFPVTAGFDMATGLGSPLMNTLAPALCATRAPVFTVTVGSPGNKTFRVHQKVKFQVPATDSGSAALFFNATGLPPGLKINASTGIVSGKVTKLGSYTVTVGAEDFATNQGTGQFAIAVVVPKAHFGKPTLHGLAARKAKLRLIVTAPAHRRLRSVTIHLSKKSGLSFKNSNRGIFLHAATGRHRAVGRRTKRRQGSLTLRFHKAQKKVVVVIGRNTLRTSRKLARRARSHSVRVPIGLSATDTKRHTTRHTARVKVAAPKHHRTKHHRTKHHHRKHHHRKRHH